MTVLDIIGTILLGPLKLLFEIIFSLAYKLLSQPGPAIIVLSLAMNILVLPLYRRADAIQIEARDTENKLKDVVSHIKKTFSGDERMMILQTYYRQNNYNPLSVLSGSLSLMLEIPFFMAAYQFLSGVEVFKNASFGPLVNLSEPDGLLVLGGITINLLPILMTVVNVVSSSLYLKGFPLKTKIQLYGMAAFFLVFLYNSPSALVFYWTLNNLFSLFKTLFYRMKNARIVLNVLLVVAGSGLIVAGIAIGSIWRTGLLVLLGLAAQLPWALPLLKKKVKLFQKQSQPLQPKTSVFILGALFLSALVGLLIPSTFIAASPQEFIDVSYIYNPVWYVVHTFCIAIGTFLVWMGVFYWLAKPSGKMFFSRLVWILSGVTVVNYMFFGGNLGVLSPDLRYADGFFFAAKEQIINAIVVVAVIAIFWFVFEKFPKVVPTVLLVGAIALTGMSTVHLVKTARVVEETKARLTETQTERPSFQLSREGKNVVVIMLDRAIGPFVPYMFEENPTLEKQFDGFTYYPNTLSYGAFTNFGTPPLFGGYEYTPVQMNLRDSEKLVDKHNEALKVLPTIFSEEGYDVTLIDPSYAGYQWIPDVSIFNDISGVDAYTAEGKFNDIESKLEVIAKRRRNFFMFSMMKVMPVSLQEPIYNAGSYQSIPVKKGVITEELAAFLSSYSVLKNMDMMTEITNGAENTYMFLRSNATHEIALLQEPTYTPSGTVDNSTYYPAEGKTITAGGESYLLDTDKKIQHYHVNMASFIQLGNWFDYLRKQGVYDNTRIILVSDHGRDLGIFDSAEKSLYDTEYYRPILLVKDFDAEGFSTSEEFMTNADVPTLATQEIIESPVNPFSGKAIDSSFKTENDTHYVILSTLWDVSVNNGNQFLPAEWAAVSGDVDDRKSWTFYDELATLPPPLQK